MVKVFISYRRDDTKNIVGRICDRLDRHFGPGSAVSDLRDQPPLGMDFRKWLHDRLNSCDAVLAVIGPRWLTITDSSGQRRLDNPEDVVRAEIEWALRKGTPIYPLVVDDGGMPSPQDLPPSLRELAFRQATTIRCDPDFHSDMNLLIEALERYRLPQREGGGLPRPLRAELSSPNPPHSREPFSKVPLFGWDAGLLGRALRRCWRLALAVGLATAVATVLIGLGLHWGSEVTAVSLGTLAVSALLLGVAASVSVVWRGWGLEKRCRLIYAPQQISEQLRLPVLGCLPPMASPQLLPWTDPKRDMTDNFADPYQEAVDILRTMLLHEATARRARCLLVTSAADDEGKTTLASHLAASLARTGYRTLLIDGNFRRPLLHQLMDLPQQPGLSEALLCEVHLSEVTQATEVDGLWFISAGKVDGDVLSALAHAGAGLRPIFQQFVKEYDYIVVDSHAVLPAPDSLLLAQCSDLILLCVRAETSRLGRVRVARTRLKALGTPVLGAVFLSTTPQNDEWLGPLDLEAVAETDGSRL